MARRGCPAGSGRVVPHRRRFARTAHVLIVFSGRCDGGLAGFHRRPKPSRRSQDTRSRDARCTICIRPRRRTLPPSKPLCKLELAVARVVVILKDATAATAGDGAPARTIRCRLIARMG